LHNSTSDTFNTVPTYFPSIAWYYGALHSQKIVLYSSLPYNRKWDANKLNLTGANGKQLLSIPIEGGRNQHRTFSEIVISNDMDWRKNHWRSLETMYRKSPYFEYYAKELKQFYDQDIQNLFSWMIQSIELLNKCLQIQLPLEFNSNSANFQIIDLGKFPDGLHYTQVFADRYKFQSKLSMLDMLFCCGPQAVAMLKKI
jgi:hypothetical protein